MADPLPSLISLYNFLMVAMWFMTSQASLGFGHWHKISAETIWCFSGHNKKGTNRTMKVKRQLVDPPIHYLIK